LKPILSRRRSGAEGGRWFGFTKLERARCSCQPADVRVLAETGWLPSTVMLPSAAIVTA
jgi:hypothetical protein